MQQEPCNSRETPRLLSKVTFPMTTVGKNHKSRTALRSSLTSNGNILGKANAAQGKVASSRSKSSCSAEEEKHCDLGKKIRKPNTSSITISKNNVNGKVEMVQSKPELQKVVRSKRLATICNNTLFTKETKMSSLKEETALKNKPNLKVRRTSSTKAQMPNEKGSGDIKGEDVTSLCSKSASDVVAAKPDPTSTCKINKEEQPAHTNSIYPLKASLFPNVPPYLHFSTSTKRMLKLPREIRSTLLWKITKVTPSLVVRIVRRSGFRIVKEEEPWISTWGRHVYCKKYSEFKENQKVNHFPGTFHLGRKDRLWMNIVKMQEMNGKRKFSFMPKTFVLPQNIDELREAWLEAGCRTKWIIKPPASARGIGINVVHHWNDVPKTEPVIVQRYISRPYLINDTKFDLRLYVLVTSFDPLRLYIYDDGLVRFASEKYSRSFKHLDEKYIHLTNYSINRCNSCYVSNEDENLRQGHKWTLKSLWSYFREIGVNDRKVWSSLVDVVIKTVISCEGPISKLVKAYTKNRYSNYELFGFDIILDNKLKPWLLEVNISPSLHTNSQLDMQIKSELIKDMFNIAGFHITEDIQLDSTNHGQVCKTIGINLETKLSYDKSLYTSDLSEEDLVKQAKFKDFKVSNSSILRNLTPNDIRQLVQSEDELARCGRFLRIFPTNTLSSYLQYFEEPKYYNLLLDAWEKRYCRTRAMGIKYLRCLCKKGLHLKTTKVVNDNTESLRNNVDIKNCHSDKDGFHSCNKNCTDPKNEDNKTSKAKGDAPLISPIPSTVKIKETPSTEAQIT